MSAEAASDGPPRNRILAAAFESIEENGYGGASTLEIATRARVSKRELYAYFSDKDAILLACIAERAKAISGSLELLEPRSAAEFMEVLRAFGYRLLKGTTRSEVVTAMRFAVARSRDLPEVARAIDKNGRRASRSALAKLLNEAMAKGWMEHTATDKAVRTFFGLLWSDLQMGLLLGVTKLPADEELRSIAGEAATNFMKVYSVAGVRSRRSRGHHLEGG
jgi:AcrR family transcriptional regulator